MAVDNSIYDEMHQDWWSDQHFMALLRHGVNPLRVQYFKQYIQPYHKIDTLLDIGCGGGFLTESMTKLGITCTGLDQSSSSIGAAKSHAMKEGLNITYINACGEKTPFSDETFDMVSCCDVLEHTADPRKVVAEAARLIKPGGIFFYDTINRTLASYVSSIVVLQNLPYTAVMPKNTHAWKMFIKPTELTDIMSKHRIKHKKHLGFGPSINSLKILKSLLDHNNRKISSKNLALQLKMKLSTNKSISYIGHGQKS